VPDDDRQHVAGTFDEGSRQEARLLEAHPELVVVTNAFSKKLENHAAMVALYFRYYNFGRMHQTIRVNASDGSRDRRSRLEHR
jgi:hypothetical protein